MTEKNKKAIGSLAIALGITILMFAFGAIYDPNKATGILQVLLAGVYGAFLMGILVFVLLAWKQWRNK